MLLMIDNYDSFTFNVYQYLEELGQQVEVFRNDEITLAEIERLDPEMIVISPGPCTPNEAGISMKTIAYFGDKLPILGICLGHQSIGQVFGARIIRAKRVMHGKTSMIWHNSQSLFKGLENPFEATRYHSLVIDPSGFPDCLEITAWTETSEGEIDEIMAVKHRELQIEGVQFHPESILTIQGHDLLRNFLHDARKSG